MPVIPGYSDTVANMQAAAAFVAALGPGVPLRLQRFRPHGTRGPARHWAPPAEAAMDDLVRTARAAGLTDVIRSR